jgi:hypothetical protein
MDGQMWCLMPKIPVLSLRNSRSAWATKQDVFLSLKQNKPTVNDFYSRESAHEVTGAAMVKSSLPFHCFFIVLLAVF